MSGLLLRLCWHVVGAPAPDIQALLQTVNAGVPFQPCAHSAGPAVHWSLSDCINCLLRICLYLFVYLLLLIYAALPDH